jgi:pimeloyl-ACP methyl ester carboxylesterase
VIVETLSIPVPGGRIAVRERGSGTPLVFLHGGTGTGEHDWAEIANRLSSRYRTVVIDLRGHGRSVDGDGSLGLVRFGLDVRHVLSALGLRRAVLVGFSVGGNSLLKLLALDARPALALVTIGASGQGDAARVEEIMGGPWPDSLTRLEHAAGEGPDYWKALRDALAHDWAANVALSDDELKRIICPVLVCHGDNDRIQHLGYARHLAATLPDAELFVARGAGHAVHLGRTEEFLGALESFLQRVLAQPSRRPS